MPIEPWTSVVIDDQSDIDDITVRLVAGDKGDVAAIHFGDGVSVLFRHALADAMIVKLRDIAATLDVPQPGEPDYVERITVALG